MRIYILGLAPRTQNKKIVMIQFNFLLTDGTRHPKKYILDISNKDETVFLLENE